MPQDMKVVKSKNPALYGHLGVNQRRIWRLCKGIITHSPGIQAKPYGVIDT